MFADCFVDTLVFHKVESTDIPLLKKYFDKDLSRSCDFTVGGVLLWKDYFSYELAEINDSLLLKGQDPSDGSYMFHAPVGNMEVDELITFARDYCRKQRSKGKILIPEYLDPSVLNDVDSNFEIEFDQSWMEYLYKVEQFTEFAGRKMEKKRNHLNYFIKNYSPYEVCEIKSEAIEDLVQFTLAFEAVHSDSPLELYESCQMIEGLRNWIDYNFDGILIRKEGRVLGYSFGEKVGDTFVLHAEKGNIKYRGIYQVLSSEMCKYCCRKYPEIKWLNREDDMGDEGLRKSKLSYHPQLLIGKKIVAI